jgi:hypothetical protein
MASLRTHLGALGTAFVLATAAGLVVALPVGAGVKVGPEASVTVCRVTGSAGALDYAQVQVSVDQLAAFLNQYPGSFVGSCPTGGAEGSGNPPPIAAVTVCRASGSASARALTEVQVAADQVAAVIAQNPGSFAGTCPPSSGGSGGTGGTGGTGPVSAVVTICRVTGSANAPRIAQVSVAVDRVVGFLNQNPGSFIGTCPGEGATVTDGPGRILGIPAGGALAICRVTVDAGALRFLQVDVAIDRFAAFLNQNPGSFVGLCPSAGDPNGTLGPEPLAYVTICRVTGNVANPLAPVTIRRDELELYLARPGTIVPAPTAGCPRSQAPGHNDPPGEPPSTTQPGETTMTSVHTTPNTVVTAKGAGTKASARSDRKGNARLRFTPKKRGIVTVRAAGAHVVQRVGVAGQVSSGRNLTG